MFSSLCSTLEKIVSSKSKNDKLATWLHFYKENSIRPDFNAYELIRLVLPRFDKARSSYGLKENALARKYIDSLCLAKGSNEAQRLIKYKTVKGTKDFPECLFHILKQRCQGSTDFALEDINRLLDGIQGGSEKHNEQVNNLVDTIVRDMPPLHQKWLCRLILKELHLGISG